MHRADKGDQGLRTRHATLSHNDNRSPLAMVDHVRDVIVAFEADLLKPYLTLDEKLKKDATAYRVEQNRIAKKRR